MSERARTDQGGDLTEILGVYNADGGLRGEATYVVGKVLGRVHCGLCDVTHSPVRRKQTWDALVARSGCRCGWSTATSWRRTRPRRWSVYSSPACWVDAATAVMTCCSTRARRGQSSSEIAAVAEKFAADFGAASFRVSTPSAAVAELRLTMGDALAGATTARIPADRAPGAALEPVEVGREDSGDPWRLSLVGRHTLVAGRSGSGKGSILWGSVASLGPWIRQDTVRVHGVDLKRGVEIAMGDGLMYRTAYKPEQAVEVLRDLLAIIDERAVRMVGQSRLHEPMPGDPLHVLVIDELAALTAYADAGVKKEGNRLLSEILTQGRAMGVVVVAFVQDPKKETVPMRGLFTQTVALRLQSVEEVQMVLGSGLSDEAPAHRIPDDMRGAGYLVTEEGEVARVRAHFWPDSLIKATAAHYPAAKRWESSREGVRHDAE